VIRSALTGSLLVLLLAHAASAQTAAGDPSDAIDGGLQPPPTSQGPMTIERVHNGFVVSPEVKATEFDKRAFPLVGGSAGFVAQDTFFIGGGGYWLPSRRSDDRRLAYGGAIFRWYLVNSDRFGVSAGTLLGAGQATVPDTITQLVFTPPVPRTGPNVPTPTPQPRSITTTVRLQDAFVVAEPEVTARIGVAEHVRLTFGAGYRFAGTDWRRNRGFDGDSSRRLSGATATFGVQIGS
jgi:hypothetical protein